MKMLWSFYSCRIHSYILLADSPNVLSCRKMMLLSDKPQFFNILQPSSINCSLKRMI